MLKNSIKILIDTTPDLREQSLRNKINFVDAVLFTHTHSDHINGIDELRVYNFWKQGEIPIYSYEEHINEIKNRFSYIFDGKEITGGGKPLLVPNIVGDSSFYISNVEIIPILLEHGPMRNMGIRIGNFAYLTDCNKIPENSYNLLGNLDILVIDALRYSKHSTHFSLSEALIEIEKIAPKRAFLTHLSHDFDYDKLVSELPDNVEPAYDGLVLEL